MNLTFGAIDAGILIAIALVGLLLLLGGLRREMGMFAALALLVLLLFHSNERFFSQNNVWNTTRQISMLTIFSIGVAFVIITGGIDLSVGSVIGLTGVLIAQVTLNAPPPGPYVAPSLVLVGLLVFLGLAALLAWDSPAGGGTLLLLYDLLMGWVLSRAFTPTRVDYWLAVLACAASAVAAMIGIARRDRRWTIGAAGVLLLHRLVGLGTLIAAAVRDGYWPRHPMFVPVLIGLGLLILLLAGLGSSRRYPVTGAIVLLVHQAGFAGHLLWGVPRFTHAFWLAAGSLAAGAALAAMATRWVGAALSLLVIAASGALVALFWYGQVSWLWLWALACVFAAGTLMAAAGLGRRSPSHLAVGAAIMIGYRLYATLDVAMNGGQPIWVGVLLAMATVIAIGYVQGWLITRLNLQPFIVTLGGMLTIRGVSQTIVHGGTLSFGRSPFRRLADTGVVPLPDVLEDFVWRDLFTRGGVSYASDSVLSVLTAYPTLICVATVLLAIYVLHFTVFGRYVYAIGGNREAARYSGINVKRVETTTYVISSGLAGLAGICYAAYIGQMNQQVGIAFELIAIAAVVLGGCSLRGGEGTIVGVVIGAALMRVIYNGINMFQYKYRDAAGKPQRWTLDTNMEFIVIGAVILLAVVMDQVVHLVQGRARTRRAAEAVASKARSHTVDAIAAPFSGGPQGRAEDEETAPRSAPVVVNDDSGNTSGAAGA